MAWAAARHSHHAEPVNRRPARGRALLQSPPWADEDTGLVS
ncbi:hypothetical protein SBI_01134 [Streptomyces bingchenggensis BCW-1]|uniref:Uncharacterized protein n=1 Tax=Streptomyces bingchenggensis (strain BCW-1) TaxID=749414 RepID=D7C894_STRBB|nr:hypothetical protein SBI_01134 [Streptomyces bingchenggensis BCW-1]